MFDVPDADKSVPGGGLIAGIGFVSGIRCMVSANDAGIDAGALQPFGLDKTLRVQELALENKLPYVQLVESAGANLLRYRVEDFIRGGNIFRNLARLSAAGLPVVTVTHGSSTAGGAYQTGLSDYIVMVRGRTRARSEEHTSELQSLTKLVCRLLLEKKNSDILRGSLLDRNIHHSAGRCKRCDGGGGHPFSVLTVGYPGGTMLQISLSKS